MHLLSSLSDWGCHYVYLPMVGHGYAVLLMMKPYSVSCYTSLLQIHEYPEAWHSNSVQSPTFGHAKFYTMEENIKSSNKY